MNKIFLMGRLTNDPEIRYTQGENPVAIARYTLAVDRRYKKDGEPTADFLRCVAIGRNAEFAEKYFRKGTKLVIWGHIQTGSYTNKDGQKVYTTDIYVDEQEFAESKSAAERRESTGQTQSAKAPSAPQTPPSPSPSPAYDTGDGFMNIPDGIEDELPFA